MNRNICNDFYDFELIEAREKWGKRLRELVHPNYYKLEIREIDFYGNQNFCILFRKNIPEHMENPRRFFLCRKSHLKDTIIDSISIFDYNYVPGFPTKYFYSNGSSDRDDGTFGFH